MRPLDSNGMVYLVQVAEGACPTRDAQMLGSINGLDRDAFAYADAGVAVHRSAVSAPVSIYFPERWRAPHFGRMLDTIIITRQLFFAIPCARY